MLRPGPWQLGEKGLHYIKTIKNSSHHLSNIINDILDAASMAKGKLVLKTERVRVWGDSARQHDHCSKVGTCLLLACLAKGQGLDCSNGLLAG